MKKKILLNIEETLKHDFENYCKSKGFSMTGRLIFLIKQEIEREKNECSLFTNQQN